MPGSQIWAALFFLMLISLGKNKFTIDDNALEIKEFLHNMVFALITNSFIHFGCQFDCWIYPKQITPDKIITQLVKCTRCHYAR